MLRTPAFTNIHCAVTSLKVDGQSTEATGVQGLLVYRGDMFAQAGSSTSAPSPLGRLANEFAECA